jgi:hypothetical protein
LLLWLVETDVFQMPQLHKHFNVRRNLMRQAISITICFILLFLSAHGQLKRTSHFNKKTQWLCGESIILDNTGLFFRAVGCEGNQSVSMGKYKVSRNGQLSFNYLPLDSILPIRSIKQTKRTIDSTITVHLFDREGKPVSSSFRIVLIDTAGKSENVWLYKRGELQINRFVYKVLILDQLTLLYGEAETIPLADSSFQIHFNLPEMFLIYPGTEVGEPEKLELLMKKDGLYSKGGTRIYTREK